MTSIPAFVYEVEGQVRLWTRELYPGYVTLDSRKVGDQFGVSDGLTKYKPPLEFDTMDGVYRYILDNFEHTFENGDTE